MKLLIFSWGFLSGAGVVCLGLVCHRVIKRRKEKAREARMLDRILADIRKEGPPTPDLSSDTGTAMSSLSRRPLIAHIVPGNARIRRDGRFES